MILKKLSTKNGRIEACGAYKNLFLSYLSLSINNKDVTEVWKKLRDSNVILMVLVGNGGCFQVVFVVFVVVVVCHPRAPAATERTDRLPSKKIGGSLLGNVLYF